MSVRRWIGLGAGITGIVLLFEPWQFDWSNGEIVFGHALLIASAILQASVIVHTRGHRWESSPTAALPWQLLVATVLLVGFAVAREAAPEIDWSLGFVLIVAYQALLATGFSAWAKQVVVLRLRATSVSLALMAIPLVGLLSSVVALGESITWIGVLGVAGIGAGVAVSILAERPDPGPVQGRP
jgi:drug/metabolite transporter (DMT)-like permease